MIIHAEIVLHDCQVVSRHRTSVVVCPIVVAAWRTQETIIVHVYFATIFARTQVVVGGELGVVKHCLWVALVQVGQDLRLAEVLIASHLLRHVEHAVVLAHVQVLFQVAQLRIVTHQNARLRQLSVVDILHHDFVVRGGVYVHVRRFRELINVQIYGLSLTIANLDLQAGFVVRRVVFY